MIKEAELVMKKSKHKRKKVKRIAADYLSNISLNGHTDTEIKTAHFDKLISNQSDCFLGFHNIHLKKELQSEYFNYYKMFVIQYSQAITHLEYFLSSEFSDFDLESRNKDVEEYIESILKKKTSVRRSVQKSLPINIPKIKILPNSPSGFAIKSECLNGISFSDTDNERPPKVLK
jgi:hypothetical protein